MKKILVVGWDKRLNNMGDIILIDATCFLVKQCGDFEVSRMDFQPQWSLGVKLFNKFWQMLLFIADKHFKWKDDFWGKLHYWLKDVWYGLLLDRYYSRLLEGYDVVITSGGGTLKYTTQDHSFYTEHLIKAASKRKCPVMLNAAGIEDVFRGDIRLRKLISTLNHSSVTYVTTRDDYKSLIEVYLTNEKIMSDKVS